LNLTIPKSVQVEKLEDEKRTSGCESVHQAGLRNLSIGPNPTAVLRPRQPPAQPRRPLAAKLGAHRAAPRPSEGLETLPLPGPPTCKRSLQTAARTGLRGRPISEKVRARARTAALRAAKEKGRKSKRSKVSSAASSGAKKRKKKKKGSYKSVANQH